MEAVVRPKRGSQPFAINLPLRHQERCLPLQYVPTPGEAPPLEEVQHPNEGKVKGQEGMGGEEGRVEIEKLNKGVKAEEVREDDRCLKAEWLQRGPRGEVPKDTR